MLVRFLGIIVWATLLSETVLATTVCGKIVKYEVPHTITMDSGVSYEVRSPYDLTAVISSALAANLNVCVTQNKPSYGGWSIDSVSR